MTRILIDLLNLYLVVLLGAIVLSWFPIEPDSALGSVQRVLWQLTDPVLAPIRRMLPQMRIDLSPLIVFFAIAIIQSILASHA